jgi:hypothetical protein
MHQGGGGNPHVVGSDQLAFRGERAVDFPILPRNIIGPREHRIGTADALPVSRWACRLTAGKFPSHGKCDVERLIRVGGKESVNGGGQSALGLAFSHDDEVRVEDQAHGLSGMGSCLAASSTESKYLALMPLPPL